MKSIVFWGKYPDALPLTADEITEFHAARVILLLHLCGTKNKIEGLTKLAKLDFFVRYPDFFKQIQLHLSEDKGSALNLDTANTGLVESSMIRYKYGPWDSRYYQLLAYLEGRRLLEVTKGSKGSFVFKLTEAGLEIARRFAQEDSYSELCQHMKEVKDLIGGKSGGVLKSLIYKVFDKEIASLPMGEIIRHDTKDIHNKIS